MGLRTPAISCTNLSRPSRNHCLAAVRTFTRIIHVAGLGQRKAHWPGAAASALHIETKLNRLLPVQCSEKLAGRFIKLIGFLTPYWLIREPSAENPILAKQALNVSALPSAPILYRLGPGIDRIDKKQAGQPQTVSRAEADG